jgi:hypothetical protein
MLCLMQLFFFLFNVVVSSSWCLCWRMSAGRCLKQLMHDEKKLVVRECQQVHDTGKFENTSTARPKALCGR